MNFHSYDPIKHCALVASATTRVSKKLENVQT